MTKVASPGRGGPLSRRNKKLEDAHVLAKLKARGPINYPPFEDLDDGSLQAVLKFQVTPFGTIHESFQHIPYSSSKKDLFEKTGRESIEALKYEFRVPGLDRVFVVMWDYNIGIVRMNPFIKWGGFPKTKSSQMLDKNPGLRDISPGPTGGAVVAQGYWVPYNCAKALCATFCHPIAGALIPLFGPSFPAECTSPDSSAYCDMIISRPLLVEASREAEVSRRFYMSKAREASGGLHGHPRLEYLPLRAPMNHIDSTQTHRSIILRDPSWGSGKNVDHRILLPPSGSIAETSTHDGRIELHSGSRFTPVNGRACDDDLFKHSDPYLTAVPHSTTPKADLRGVVSEAWTLKRRRLDYDRANPGAKDTAIQRTISTTNAAKGVQSTSYQPEVRSLGHFDAAMVLVTMKKDSDKAASGVTSTAACSRTTSSTSSRRYKRQRARSL